jgi:hypothetical protein
VFAKTKTRTRFFIFIFRLGTLNAPFRISAWQDETATSGTCGRDNGEHGRLKKSRVNLVSSGGERREGNSNRPARQDFVFYFHVLNALGT